MSPQPLLETKRLILRPFQLSDAKEVQRLAGVKEIASTTLNIPHPYPDGAAEAWISTHQDTYEAGKGVVYAITYRVVSHLVGAISLMDLSQGHQAELGYWIGSPHWNRGYCTEAARALMQFGFERLGLHRIHARHLSRNPASGRVMQKLGMQYEGKRRQHVEKWGVFEDLEMYGILKAEWEANSAQ
jgi:RimJ/RimL family protein N-acetyltransferase